MFEVSHKNLFKALSQKTLDPQDLLGLELDMGMEQTPARVIAVSGGAVDLQHRRTGRIVRDRSLHQDPLLQEAVWFLPPPLHSKMQEGLKCALWKAAVSKASEASWGSVLRILFDDPERLRRQEGPSFRFLRDMRDRFDRNPKYRLSQKQEKWLNDVLTRRTRAQSH